jgi:Na+/proline symporter
MMAGELSFWDWLIISLYLIFTMGVGVYFSKRASSSTQEYFLGGRLTLVVGWNVHDSYYLCL